MRRSRALLAAFLALVLLPIAAYAAPSGPQVGVYEGPGTIVTSFNLPTGQLTAVDNGAVICRDADNDGIYESGQGGLCIRWEQLVGDALHVEDDMHGNDVAFQVCIDGDGDGVCAGGREGAAGGKDPTGLIGGNGCGDLILFSHSSFDGSFHNPMHIGWIESYWHWCGGVGFPGVILIMCAGAHSDAQGLNPHTHQVSRGRVFSTWGGSGYGDYCGGPVAAKAYRLE